MTEHEIRRRFPHASKTFIKNNSDGVAHDAEPKRSVRHAPHVALLREKENPKRYRISVVSFRKRLIDPDNLCPKYFIDALRYEGLIADDSAKHIILEVRQEKVTHQVHERTEITIEEICSNPVTK